MATRLPKFTAIPNIPQQGLSEWHFITLNAIKENIDMLIGARGKDVSAVTRGSVTVTTPAQTLKQVTALGTGYTINGVTVAGLTDYVKLVKDVQQLANDVASLQNTLTGLLNQLKG